MIRWYSDEAENRYQAGNPEADPAIYTNTNKSFGLHGELSEEHQKLASSEAQLVISNNVSKRGGGIATNSPVVIGMEYADVAVEVTKKMDRRNSSRPRVRGSLPRRRYER